MIVLKNKGLIDLQVLSTFGVSVKESDSPIGYFGTGLKYALAVLMREKQQVEIWLADHKYAIGIEKLTIRGTDKNGIVLIDCETNEVTKLGFTDELGKNWGVRHAYRELACNCMDEKGEIFDITAANYLNQVNFADDETNIIVSGSQFLEAYRNRGEIILADEKHSDLDYRVEVRDRPSQNVYYRGVDVLELNKPCLFNYNFKNSIELTEDRTIKNTGYVSVYVAAAWCESKDKEMIRKVVMADENSFENTLDFDWYGTTSPSKEFVDVVGELLDSKASEINPSAVKVWQRITKKPLNPKKVKLTKVQQSMLDRALNFLLKNGYDIYEYEVSVVEQLGSGCLGLAHDDRIYITIANFDAGGTKAVASVLLEEYIHLKQGVADCSRQMQQYLFDKLLSAMEELQGKPL